jgi:predicted O-methyltransferase YrrM
MHLLFLIADYIRFLIAKSRGSKVASGLNEEFFNFCNDKSRDYKRFAGIEEVRKQLLKSTEIIDVTDFGQGPKNINSGNNSDTPKLYKRKVSEIAAKSLKSEKECIFISKMVEFLKPENILELGTSLGITSSYIAKANNNALLTTVEGCFYTLEIAKSVFCKLELKNINAINSTFEASLHDVFIGKKIDMAFIDGNHAYQPVMNYFNIISQQISERGVVIIDDIRWSSEMKKAWSEIKKDQRITLSIDLFSIGIVFFNKAFVKEHIMMKI